MILDDLIGENSKYYKQFNDLDFLPSSWNENNKAERLKAAYMDDLGNANAILKAIIYGVQEKLI